MNRKVHLAAAWAGCAVWMAVIYMMSAAPGEVSSEQSGMIVELLAEILPEEVVSDVTLMERLEMLVRKVAHTMEYAVLLCLYRHALRLSGVKRAGVTAFLMSVGYAAMDELHQAFVPDRGPSPIDVMIDACGALLGWAAICAVECIKRRIIRFYRQKSAQDGE